MSNRSVSKTTTVERRVPLLLLLTLLAPIHGFAQEAAPADSAAASDSTTAADSVQAEPDFLEGFRFYGSLRGQIAVYRETAEVQGNGSRIGFRLTRDFNDQKLKVFGQVELGLRLIDDISGFNVSAQQGGLGRLEFGDDDEVVYARLGFLGLDLRRFGILTLGKQWGAYYDVSGYTDNFFVFGGQASGTYPLGGDGGGLGTGRAERAITYRTQLGGLTVGAQAQLEASRLTGLGSYGGSIQYGLPFGLTLGVAGNFGDVPDAIANAIPGADDHEHAVVMGAKFERPRFLVAATYSIQHSHDVRDIPFAADTATVAFDARGIEVYGHYEVSRRFRVSGGFNWLDPDVVAPLDPDFRIRYWVVGGAFYLNSQSLAYLEWRLDDSVGPAGLERANVLAFGLRLDFGLPEMLRNDSPPLRFPDPE